MLCCLSCGGRGLRSGSGLYRDNGLSSDTAANNATTEDSFAQPLMAAPRLTLPAPGKVYPYLQEQSGTTIAAATAQKTPSFIDGTELDGKDWTYHNVWYYPNFLSQSCLFFYPKYDNSVLFDTAYKIYKWNLTGYSGPASITFHWLNSPAWHSSESYSSYFVGFATQSGNWTWFPGPSNGTLNLSSFTPYLDQNGNMLVWVLVEGINSNPSLESMSIGINSMTALGPEYIAENRQIRDLYIPSCPSSYDLSQGLPQVGDQMPFNICGVFACTGGLDCELSQIYHWEEDKANGGNLMDRMRSSPRFVFLEDCYLPNIDPLNTGAEFPIFRLIDIGAATEQTVP
jgi:hypothetical protein